MLQLHNICKQYKTGDLVQTALNDVSLNLRDNEFVAILGPSGSGKSTLLNIIGGLDRYDSGDLIINGISTKKYTDRDWDSYRNHTIGFVFQSYNLIPHQSVLSNVELALTISGISKAERRRRAQEALREVGLGDQMHKKPNQMSGGQMQRVAIARALVNNPDILLADEPTGALDTETSIQVMELLKEVAKDRLVVMVTHNPELAEEYATRIVRIQDGQLKSDSDPYVVDEAALAEPEHKNMGHSSMSFLTSLSLSLNNLATKKTRTFMTAFAGSIGIIGIALILSISTGVNDYIQNIEEETMSEYPVQITSSGFDLTSIMSTQDNFVDPLAAENEDEITVTEVISAMFTSISSNDIAALKEYLESGESGIEDYVKGIEYIYDIEPQIYIADGDGYRQINPNTLASSTSSVSASSSISSYMSMMTSYVSGMNVFYQMPENEELYVTQYEIKAGRWPESYNECVLVLTSSGSVSDLMLYMVGLEDYSDLEDLIARYQNGEDVSVTSIEDTYSYDEILGLTFQLIVGADCYAYDSEYGIWVDKSEDASYMNEVIANGEELTIVGIVQPMEDASSEVLSSGINYPASLVEHIVEEAMASEIVQEQMANPDINVLSGEEFGEEGGDFDLSSILTIDEDALAEAFDFGDLSDLIDTDSLTDSLDLDSLEIDLDSLDLSGMEFDLDLSGLELDLSGLDLSGMEMELDLSGLDMSSLLSSITINASEENISALIEALMEGYWDSVPEEYSDLEDIFAVYIESERAQNILTEWMESYGSDILSEIIGGGGSESGGTESGGSESGDTESSGSESGDTESGGTESGGTESGDTESGDTESGDSESGDTESGDSESGDTESGDTESGGSESGDTESGDSESGDTESSGSESGDTESGDSESGDTESGDTESGDSESGDTESGDTESGDSESGDTESGDTESGDSESGDTESGDTESGDSESGDTESGDTESGDTESGDTESSDTESDGTESSDTESGDTEGGDSESGDTESGDTAEEAAQSTVSLTNLSYSATSLKSRSLTGSVAQSSATSYTLLSSTEATGNTDETDAEQNDEEDTAQDSESTVNVVVDPDALSELLTALTEDFTSYLEENGLGFTDYLSSDTASQILMSGLMSMIDTTELENQLTSAIEAAITDMMTELMNVIAQAIEEQMTEIMEELMEAIEEEITEVMTEMMTEIMDEVMNSIETAMTQMMEDMTDSLETAFEIDSDVLAEAFQFNLDSESLAEIMTSLSSSTSYDSNLEAFGYLDFDNPSEIDIYPKDFKSKDVVIDILDAYNQRMEDEGKSEQVITYTDTVGLLMSSVTTIIDVISYVLIAFVSVSLIVSSIMIGIITYISVLERTREIGILRAIGASKNNISQIFNAETLIVGFCAGMIGIGVSYALLVPINYLIHRFAGTTDVSAVLMPQYAVILVVLSMVLTLIGGLIPSASAAKKDPVTALRTD